MTIADVTVRPPVIDSRINTTLIMPTLSLAFSKKYFVVNLNTSERKEVYAKSPDEACDSCGWFRTSCFVKLMVDEVEYEMGTRPL